MKKLFPFLCAYLLAALAVCQASELAPALKQFAGYEFGQPKKVLHDTRMTAFHGTNDEQLRLENEQLLLAFVESDASVLARREACLWLSELGTEASRSVLTRLRNEEAFADVAQIALDALTEKAPAAISLAAPAVAEEDASKLEKLSREGPGGLRQEAIRKLGLLGREQDAAYLVDLFCGTDAAVAGAAGQALRAMPEASLRNVLLERLNSEHPAQQAKAIQLVELRGTAFAADELWRMAGQDGNPNSKAAIRALGKAAPPSDYERLLDAFVNSEGTPFQKDWQMAAWDLSRRQPDYSQALLVLKQKQSQITSMAGTLAALASKLESLQTGPTPYEVKETPKPVAKKAPKEDVSDLTPGPYQDLVPKRFEVAAYLNCGPGKKVTQNGVSIECINGKPFNSSPDTDPSFSVLFSGSTLDFNLVGLEPGQDYILGMTWWDVSFNERWQSVLLNGEEVLPDTRAIAFDEHRAKKGPLGRPTPTRIQFALLPEHIQNGACKISITGARGPNVVNSELWVAQRVKPKADKQVLLVSGQDFPGHHWRKTGPVMENLITQDPRMEVTICETPYALGLTHLEAYDVVFLHCKNYRDSMPSSPAMQDRLQSFVLNGGGLCMSHFACGAFMEWPDFVNLSGRIWSRGGHDPRGPFTVKVVDQKHPVTRGLGAEFQTDDELYWCLTGEPDIHLLCEAMSTMKKANQPQAMVFEPGKGRTFLCTLGHDVRAYESETVKQLYRRGTAWAAGLE